MILFNGRQYAQELDLLIAKHVEKQKKLGKLVLIQIGENAASSKYVELKMKLCERFTIPSELLLLGADKSEGELFSAVREKLAEKDTTGAIIQLPLPTKNLEGLLDSIPADKDVDKLSSTCQSQFYAKKFNKLPPVIRALKLFLTKNQLNVDGMSVFVVGAGFLVGKPVEYYLKSLGAHVTVINNYKAGTLLNCQLLVLSAGIPNLVNGKDINAGCNVVDFGSSMVNGRVVGDLNMQSDIDHLGAVSASPGGVGPLVVRYLIMNHLGI